MDSKIVRRIVRRIARRISQIILLIVISIFSNILMLHSQTEQMQRTLKEKADRIKREMESNKPAPAPTPSTQQEEHEPAPPTKYLGYDRNSKFEQIQKNNSLNDGNIFNKKFWVGLSRPI